MEDGLQWIGALVVAAVIAGRSALISVRARRALARKLRGAARAPISPIATAVEGDQVRVVGAVAATTALLTAPLTGRRCVTFHAVVEAYTAVPHAPWMIVAEERQAIDFAITDGTGRALIDVSAADFELEGDRIGNEIAVPTQAIRDMFERNRDDPRARPFAKRLRFYERACEVGTQLAVVGVAVREPDPDAPAAVSGYREGPPTRLHFSGTPRQPCLVTDADAALR